MPITKPLKDEKPLAFVERAEAMGMSEGSIDSILMSHFGMSDDGEIKALKLKSRVFWEQFYIDRVTGIHKRGGSRYSAVRFIERKNGQAGQQQLTAKQIDDLVDSVGAWKR